MLHWSLEHLALHEDHLDEDVDPLFADADLEVLATVHAEASDLPAGLPDVEVHVVRATFPVAELAGEVQEEQSPKLAPEALELSY
jgi:hypothetical protein